jgi:hypothetical protein
VAGKASWDPANRRQKLGLVWKTKRKLAKFLMNTFTYRSSSFLFYGKFAKSKNKRNTNLVFLFNIPHFIRFFCSLYEGWAGTACFLVDLIHHNSAAFPFSEVFH